MASNSGTEALDKYIEGPYILQMSGLRFSQGIRSVSMLAKMMEERFQSEDRTAHALQDYACDWTKKLADISSSGNGDFDHGSMYKAITRTLMEPIEDAKISNLVKNEGLGDDGPVAYLHSWKEQMERSYIPKDTINLYSTASEKQISTEKEIERAMEYYHLRKYKLENGLRQLRANPPVLSWLAEARLRKSMYRYLVKCEDAQEEYKKLLKMEEAERGKYLAAMKIAERRFKRFEKDRMMHTKAGIEKFLDSLDKLDTERSNHLAVVQDIIGLLDNMDVDAATRKLEAQYTNRAEFPVFKNFDEKTLNQKDKKKTWLKKLNLGTRKRNQTGLSPEVIIYIKRNKQVIMSDENNPNLVREFTISDDDSDDIKVITTPSDIVDDNEDNESDSEIFEFDEKGREIKMKPKPHPKTSDVRALGKLEKLTNVISIKVKAAPTTKQFGLPNAIESDSETDMWVISTRNRTIELDVDRDTSPVPPKLSKKAKKRLNKAQKESAESIKQIKESRKFKDKGQTEVSVEKRKGKGKIQEKVIVESYDSETDTHVPDAEFRTLANVKVIAIEDYIAQNRDELTFKAESAESIKPIKESRKVKDKGQTEDNVESYSQKIKQKIPANSDGMAYGWILKGKLRRKIYGYYPANLVELKPKKEKTGIRGLLSKTRGIMKFAS